MSDIHHILGRLRGRMTQQEAALQVEAVLGRAYSYKALGRLERGEVALVPADVLEALLRVYGATEADRLAVQAALVARAAVGGAP